VLSDVYKSVPLYKAQAVYIHLQHRCVSLNAKTRAVKYESTGAINYLNTEEFIL
jgi:hypothetical protein